MILPGATLGVVGGGQLGRMFALRARSMGFGVVVLEPDLRSPAAAAANHQILAPYDDPSALRELAERCDAITTEFENVSAAALELLARSRPVCPPGAAVAIIQDRIAEKEHLVQAGFPTVPFRAVRSRDELDSAVAAIGVPSILKTARLGYDGKGQIAIDHAGDAESAWDGLGRVACVLERRVSLELELSVVLARGRDGRIEAFPPAENRHSKGILDTTVVPARVPAETAARAEAIARGIAGSLEYAGVLAVEMFVAEGGRLYVNELAPRPHNSGHYTMDAFAADQFEQQIRTMCGLPLARGPMFAPAAAMANLLGDLWAGGVPRWERALSLPGVRLHLYGKTEARPGRKMGHLNCLAASPEAALALVQRARAALMD